MKKVKIETSLGDITVHLYDQTPQHRDNFIKLVTDGFYDGLLFHRVIRNFMIQAGDPNSKDAPMGKQLGSGDVGYTIPAEFVYPKYFHKKGALAAARTGDEVNPERRSSGCQFYIVTGEVYNEGKLKQIEHSMAQQQLQNIFNGLVAENRNRIIELRKNRDKVGLMKLQEELEKVAHQRYAEKGDSKFTSEQKELYTTIGGTPFLDNNYTVFGEVVEGFDVIDNIQSVKTQCGDRPCEDIKILKAEIL